MPLCGRTPKSQTTAGDPSRELEQEIVRTVRAERRLREHELTRRRVLLALTVVLPIVGIVLSSLGDPYAGTTFVGGGLLSAVIPRSASRYRSPEA